MTVNTLSKHTDLIRQAEKSLAQHFEEIDEISLFNQRRVLQAFKNNRLSEVHFAEQTGYGLGDHGREIIDDIYAEIMQAESAAVRLQFVSGTHAIACALLGNLKTGDRIVALTGRPYDTLQPVVGLNNPNRPNPKGVYQQSIIGSGIKYKEMTFDDALKLIDSESVNPAAHSQPNKALQKKLTLLLEKPTTLVHIQKSPGYDPLRRALTNEEISKLCKIVRQYRPEVTIFVDNCYGEFVERQEPTASGADLIAGSLIKNPGGGLVITGGYIAGKKELVEQALIRLTAPGLDGQLGLLYNQNRLILQGLFTAPTIVANAVKGAMLTALVMEQAGFLVNPKPFTKRSDIVQTIEFGSEKSMVRFCQAIQASSPVDGHVIPEPGPLPGYADPVIMAAGNFIQGSSIELSADGPMRPPFRAYQQGALTYQHIKCMLENVLEYLNLKTS